jgi:hypothetical protein
VLAQMLDRAALQKVQVSGGAGAEGVSVEQAEEILIQAIAVAGASGDPGLRPALEALRDSDPSLKVRDAAKRALASLGV